MKKFLSRLIVVFLVAGILSPGVIKMAESAEPGCDNPKTTICTIEIWLSHQQKKRDKELRKFLKSRSLKVLRHTIQYWKPRGGHPPTNVAIGSGLSVEDARFVIDLAIEYNDKVDMLVIQSLNPPNYVAIATSAWDEKSQIPITEKDLEALRDPKLSTAQFHELYRKLTDEATLTQSFY